MDFTLDAQSRAIFEMAQAFGTAEIAPHARTWEQEGSIPRALWTKAATLGFGGLYVDEAQGGAGLSRLDGVLVFEALSMACPSVAAFLSIHNMCAAMIARHGSASLKARFMPGIISMEKVFSYCLTEPGSGSDAAALRCRAERAGSGWELHGEKAFISGGGYSDGYIVMCRTGGDGPHGISAVIVEDSAPGLSFGALEDKMGWRAQPTRQVRFDACAIPPGNLLGEEGRGFSYAMAALDGGRLNIAACALGGAQTALERTLAHMRDREAFGRKLDQFQALQFRLADMEVKLETARIFLRTAAARLDSAAADATKYCAMAKLYVTDQAFDVVNQCLQLHGGYGYLADYGIEKILRDLRVHQILEGTNEIMRLIISRAMLAERE
ncbi:MAG: acyl-CoA dehydrogenase family protein [Pseudorhodobacter sp.]